MASGWNARLSEDGVLEILWNRCVMTRSAKPLDIISDGLPSVSFSQQLKLNRLEAFVTTAQGGRVHMVSRFRSLPKAVIPTLVEEREVRFLSDVPNALLSIRYDLLPEDKSRHGFLVIPALWYGDNEAWNNKIDYPKGLEKDWSFKADGSSCPAVVWSGRSQSYAVGLDATLRVKTDHPGMDDIWGIGFEAAKVSPRALLTFPAQEIPESYPWGHKLKASKKPQFSFKKGMVLRFNLFHHAGPADKGFHTHVWRQRLSMASPSLRYKSAPSQLDKTAKFFTTCLKKSHFHSGRGFSHRHDIPEIFSGWCGGFAAAFAAIRWGDAIHDEAFRRMGETMGDFICDKGVSPSGFFYSEYAGGLWLEKTFWAKGQGIPMRNPSEGACYLALMIAYEKTLGHARTNWEKALVSNLDAVLRGMKKDGALPQEVDGKTGRPLSWVGTTPATWVGALAVFSRVDADRLRARRYLSAAKRIAAYYLKHYIDQERYIGGPYDTYMAPNMEDPYNLLLAYAELHKTTGEKRWLKAERKIADHLLSWRYVHDVRFPDGTWCRKQKVKTFAMSPASVSNKHIQNWDTLADTYLLDLTRQTGEPLYADAALQHLYASTQLVQKGQLPKRIPYGGQSEQWYATDFNWFGDSGSYSKGNVWQISVALPKAGFLISMAERKRPFVLKDFHRDLGG
jgi:hypothetical protein